MLEAISSSNTKSRTKNPNNKQNENNKKTIQNKIQTKINFNQRDNHINKNNDSKTYRHKHISKEIREKHPKSIRILSLNIATISIKDSYKICNLLQFLRENNIDIACISEINMNCHNYQNTNKIRKLASRIWKNASINFASTPDVLRKSNSVKKPIYQQGGVMLITAPSICTHKVASGRDPLGRWTWIETESKQRKKKQ